MCLIRAVRMWVGRALLGVLAIVAACHRFDSSTYAPSVSDGGSNDGGIDSGGGEGGAFGGAWGGVGGSAAGEAGGGADGGSEPGVSDPKVPTVFGTVRLLLDGTPVCGGTLLSNSWVLTADQCVGPNVEPGSIEVGLGPNSSKFDQTRTVREIVRWPGNDGTPASRGRDLTLLGVDEPFVIEGSTTTHHRPVWPWGPGDGWWTVQCVGWDLAVDPQSPTDHLQQRSLLAVDLERNVTNGSRPAGERYWWLNTSPNALDGTLPMPADVGTGCFLRGTVTDFQTTVHAGNPPELRKGGPNEGREAYSQSVCGREIGSWLDSVMFAGRTEPFDLPSRVGLCSSAARELEVFSVLGNGAMGVFRWDGVWQALAPVPPPEPATLSRDRPGVLCTPDGGIELLARSADGALWWQHRSRVGAWNDRWQRVGDASTPIASGVSVVGVVSDHFHVFAIGTEGELRHAEFDQGWTGKWELLGEGLVGTPAARMGVEDWIEVFARGADSALMYISFSNGWREWEERGSPITSDPAVATWAPERVDVMFRTEAGTLGRVWNYGEGSRWTSFIDTGIPMPEGEPVALAWEQGRLDLFVTPENGGNLWHAWWPREPSEE